jgi:hypothetical protein
MIWGLDYLMRMKAVSGWKPGITFAEPQTVYAAGFTPVEHGFCTTLSRQPLIAGRSSSSTSSSAKACKPPG